MTSNPQKFKGWLKLPRDGSADVRCGVLLSFIVSALSMLLIYCCLGVWPIWKNSVLVLDLNAQYIYYFEQLRDVITTGETLLYSFERALGGEFMGIFAYYLSSPFSLIVALFPKESITEAMYLILILKTGCAGAAFSYLLSKKFRLKTCNRVMFSVMYALSSYVVVMQNNVMWIDNVIAFPLILLAVDSLICEGKFKLYTVMLVYSVMSNFYIGYMTCIFVLVWFFVRYFMLSPDERNLQKVKLHFIKTLGKIALFSLIAIMISAIIILPVYYSLGFGKLEFSDPKYEAEQMFEFADLLTKAFFGSYDSVRPSGMPFIYCGTLALVLAPLYFFAEKIPTRKKIGMAFIMLFLIASFNFSIFDIIWHGMQRPNWLNARFAYMFSGLMLIMAVRAFENLREIGHKAAVTSAVLWCAALIILAKFDYEHLRDFVTVWAGILVLVVTAGIIPSYVRSLNGVGTKNIASAVLTVFVVIEAVGNGVIMLYYLDDDVGYSKRASYRQMVDTYSEAVEIFKDDESDEFYRAEKLVHRKKNDNFALDINGLSNSTSTLNARTIDLLAQFGYAATSHWSMYAGATAVTDALFGVKYVMADESDSKPVMDYIHSLYELIGSTDEGIDVYENPYELSIAYAVKEEVAEFDTIPEDPDDDEYTDPFTYMNELLAEMIGREVEIWTKVDIESTSDSGVEFFMAEGHRGYEKDGSGTAKVTYTLNIEDTKPVYVYFPSDYPRDADMKLDGIKLCLYFEGKDFSIRELGSFEVGDNPKLELVLKQDKMYIKTGYSYFWYFDEEAFVDAIAELTNGKMDAHSTRDDYIYGTITVPEGDGLVFTTIPYDEEWIIKVDGQVVEKTPTLNGSLISFKVSPGEHELEFSYEPRCVKYGTVITFVGCTLFALICAADYTLKRRKSVSKKSSEITEITVPTTEGDNIYD